MIKKVLIALMSIVCFSCMNLRNVRLTVIGSDEDYVKIYNGNKLILEDTLTQDFSTSIAFSDLMKVNFSDSLVVTSSFNGKMIRVAKKLKKVKYIYIDQRGVNFEIIGTNDKMLLL